MTSIPNDTLPWIEDTPMTSKVIVLLLCVKTTLNKLAVKLEFCWQALREFDSINRTAAEAPERRERSVVKKTNGESNIEDRMMAFVC